MKLSVVMPLLALMASLLVACGGSSEKPEEVVRNVLTLTQDFENLDYDKLRSYTTEGSSAQIDEMEKQMTEMIEKLGEEELVQFREQVKKMAEQQDLESIKCEEEEDKATCTFCCTPMGNEDDMTLVKQDGKWLVDMTAE